MERDHCKFWSIGGKVIFKVHVRDAACKGANWVYVAYVSVQLLNIVIILITPAVL
jgi:hypothetical protein